MKTHKLILASIIMLVSYTSSAQWDKLRLEKPSDDNELVNIAYGDLLYCWDVTKVNTIAFKRFDYNSDVLLYIQANELCKDTKLVHITITNYDGSYVEFIYMANTIQSAPRILQIDYTENLVFAMLTGVKAHFKIMDGICADRIYEYDLYNFSNEYVRFTLKHVE